MRRVLALTCVTILGAANAEDLTIQTTELPDGKVQEAYTATLTATGGTAPYKWTALPAMRTREASTWATYGQGGEATGWRQDGASCETWEVPLPFDFPFCGKTYRTAHVNENGLVDFTKTVPGSRTELQWDNVGLTAFSNRDLSTLTFGSEPCNIYVETNSSDHVLIRWAAISPQKDGGVNAQKPTVNVAVVLYPDGRIRFSYGSVTTAANPDSATVFVGLKNGSETFGESFSPTALSEAQDIVLRTAVLPDGLTLAADGTLSGMPTTAGAAGLVAQVKDAAGAAATNYFPLTIAENTNEKPVVTGYSPAAEGATVKAGGKLAFTVTASDPEGETLSYTWKVSSPYSGVTNTTSDAAWMWQTASLDCGIYTVTCEVSDGGRSESVTWSVFVDRGFTWHVATNGGNDANDGRDAARPFKTLAKALEAAGDGETILVGPGVYSEIDTSGIPKTRICVADGDGRRLTIRATASDPAQTVIDGAGKVNCLVFTETQTLSTNVVVEGFTLRNGKTPDNLAFGGGAFGGDLRRCVITNCVSRFSGGGAAYAKLTDCTIVGCTAASDGGGAYESELVRCIVRENVLTTTGADQTACGAGLAGGWARNTLIVENVIANTLKTGYGGGVCDTACTNCTIVANWNKAQAAYGAVTAKSAQKPCVNTILYGNQVAVGVENGIYGLSADLRDHTIVTWQYDTLFVNESRGDFRPKADSPAIDAGTGLFAEDATDLGGAARVRGWSVDCGAYEYQADYAVTGDADAGFTVTPDADVTDFVATIPASVDAAKVTVEVAPEITSVTPNGAAVKVVRTTDDAAYDITGYLDIPAAESGVVNLAAATVKAEYANPLDVAKGATIDLRNPSAPSLTTAPTVPGLVYTLREGKTLDALANGDTAVGNGAAWTPALTVKGGTSGFYTIRVSK